MKTKLISCMIALLFIAVQSIEAKPKVLLRMNLEKGAAYQMTITSDNSIDQQMMGQQMKVQQKMEMGSTYKVLDVLPNKNYLIEYSFDKMKMDMDINGQKVSINSEDTTGNVVSRNMKELTSMKIKFTMDSQGKIQSIEGMDEYEKKVGNNQELGQILSMFANADNFKASFGQYLGFFPDNEVEVGSKWDLPIKMPSMLNMDMNLHYTVNDITDDQVVLGVNSEVNMDSPIKNNGMEIQMKATGTQTGTTKVDLKSGIAGTTDINQKFDMNMKMKNPQSGEDMEIPMIMNAITKVSMVKI
ncbi:MAG: DUF6263 family protein [Candidatus Saccharibacteria bacterium]